MATALASSVNRSMSSLLARLPRRIIFIATTRFKQDGGYRILPKHRIEEAAAARAATVLQRQLAAAEDSEVLARLDPRENEVISLSAAEHAAFVSAVQPVVAKYRNELDRRLFTYLD